jgi:hypothetical protein
MDRAATPNKTQTSAGSERFEVAPEVGKLVGASMKLT